MKTFETIEFELTNGIATIWLNRPEVHNALNELMISEIIACYEEINNMADVRVVILRGRGKSFCAGADLNYMKGIAEFGFEENYQDSLRLAKCFNAIYTCKKPTIAIVHGAAIGGANGLLASCDFVYCADDTKFAFSEVKLGIAPATISLYVVKRIGEYGARDLMLTGRRFTGKDAEWYRLANKSLPVEELDEHVGKIIKTLLSSGPDAIAACKSLIYNISNKMPFEEAIDYTAKLIAELRASNEGQEGMASFLEKRKPNWVVE
ncbi:MAG: enoyl-CoA hydratase [Marinilabiliales bacterium]|nr:MAG: enoyl-CoA hydratase [Marinilabiliales bacterium]